jgi:hypothetical protein
VSYCLNQWHHTAFWALAQIGLVVTYGVLVAEVRMENYGQGHWPAEASVRPTGDVMGVVDTALAPVRR